MSSFDDSIVDCDNGEQNTGDDTILPFDDERDYDQFRSDQDKAFGGLYGC